MSYFGQMLDMLMQLHGYRAMDLCQAVHINKSYFTKMKNGTLLPKDYALVEALAEAMRLTAEERAALDIAYKNTKYGPAYGSMELSVKRMFSVKLPEECMDNPTVDMVLPPNGSLIHGKQHIMQAASQLMQEAEEYVNLLFIPEHEDVCKMLCHAAAGMRKETKLNWLLYLCSKNGVSDENVSVFVNALPLMLTKRSDVRFEYVNFIEYDHYAMFPFLLMSEQAVLVMDRTVSEAIYFDGSEFVNVYRIHFGERFHHARQFAVVYDSLEDFLKNTTGLLPEEADEESSDLYVVENRPCIVHEAGYEDILTYISDVPNKTLLARKYAEFLAQSQKKIKKQHLIFSAKGMQEYFMGEEYYEISRFLTKSISKPVRMKLFERLVTTSKESRGFSPNILRTPFFEAGNIHLINLWSNGKMLFLFHFADRFYLLTMYEKSIATSMIAYLQMLMDCGIILSKQDSIHLMEQMLDTYGQEE